jgi:sugar phosphate isomerase/epimerase
MSTNLNRRDLLKAIGAGATAAAAGIPAALAADDNPSAPSGHAHKIKLAIFTSVYGHLPLDEAAKRIKADGFAGVVLDYAFKDVRFDPWAPDFDALKKITAALDREGLQVAGLYGYYNVIDPDAARRKRGEARIDLLIKNWKRFGSPVISTETGSFNPQSEFEDSEKNHTEEGYAECRRAFERLARAAEKTGAVIAIEAYWHNCIDSIDRADRLFRDIDSPSLKLTMDPCNFFRPEDLPKMKPMLEDMFKRLGPRTVIAHAKDVKQTPAGQELPAAGLGVLDYPTFLRLLAGLDKDLFLALEHLNLDDVPRARDYVKAQMQKALVVPDAGKK